MNSSIMKNKKFTAAACVILAATIAAIVICDALKKEKTTEKTAVAMGSVVTVKLYGTDKDEISDSVIKYISEMEDERISRYKSTSEIYSLNENGTYEMSLTVAETMRSLIQFSADSNGAFDPTMGKLSSLWDFDNDTKNVPSDDEIASLLKNCGAEKIKIDGNTFTLAENTEIDLGAVGKGYACDAARLMLDSYNVKGAVVTVGGSVMTYGKNPDSDTWTVGVRTPEKDDDSIALKINLTGLNFISTSGNYEKCFTKDGVLYHHILSPETGHPADSGLKSVTVICNSGTLSDALSTACFVLGMDKCGKLLDMYDAEAVFITNDNKVYTTDGISVEMINNKYSYGN